MEQGFQQRQVAYKIGLSEIHNSQLIKQEGWLPNYIEYGGRRISRVNILGVIISIEPGDTDSFMVDDGCATITVRKFESSVVDMTKHDIGSVVNVIGKIREYNDEKYILPEAIQELEPKWLEVRKKEIQFMLKTGFYVHHTDVNETAFKVVEETMPVPKNAEGVFRKIRDLDDGEGADISKVIDTVGPEAEHIIQTMMEQGDIFCTRPGKVKILE